jgi:hypothetical protein
MLVSRNCLHSQEKNSAESEDGAVVVTSVFIHSAEKEVYACQRKKNRRFMEQTLMLKDLQCNCADLLMLIPGHTQGITRNDRNSRCLLTHLFCV